MILVQSRRDRSARQRAGADNPARSRRSSEPTSTRPNLVAVGMLHGDSPSVTYSLDMRMSDFIDGV
jgi:hypothetical protein